MKFSRSIISRKPGNEYKHHTISLPVSKWKTESFLLGRLKLNFAEGTECCFNSLPGAFLEILLRENLRDPSICDQLTECFHMETTSLSSPCHFTYWFVGLSIDHIFLIERQDILPENFLARILFRNYADGTVQVESTIKITQPLQICTLCHKKNCNGRRGAARRCIIQLIFGVCQMAR